jgi:hypothetical protein
LARERSSISSSPSGDNLSLSGTIQKAGHQTTEQLQPLPRNREGGDFFYGFSDAESSGPANQVVVVTFRYIAHESYDTGTKVYILVESMHIGCWMFLVAAPLIERNEHNKWDEIRGRAEYMTANKADSFSGPRQRHVQKQSVIKRSSASFFD